jgi:hypothetical protein
MYVHVVSVSSHSVSQMRLPRDLLSSSRSHSNAAALDEFEGYPREPERKCFRFHSVLDRSRASVLDFRLFRLSLHSIASIAVNAHQPTISDSIPFTTL